MWTELVYIVLLTVCLSSFVVTEVCSFPKDSGSCRNFTVKWFFDIAYGGCSRFWYGGCDGNGNKFDTIEDCENVCVKPEGPDPVIACPIFSGDYYFVVHYDNGQSVNSKALFSCKDPKHKVFGPKILTCLPSGQWSGDPPQCLMPSCTLEDLYSVLPEYVIPDINSVEGDFVPYDVSIGLKCEDNKRLIGSSNRAKCKHEGKWEIGIVQCVIVCTPVEEIPDFVVVIDPEDKYFRIGQMVTFSCIPGHKLTTEIERITCLPHLWSQELRPNCVVNKTEDFVSDQGTASNEDSEHSSIEKNDTVVPEVTDGDRVITASVNSSVELRCFVRGLDRYAYLSWTRTDGGKIPPSAKSRLQGVVLYIPKVQPEDAGEYSCLGIVEGGVVLLVVRARLAVVVEETDTVFEDPVTTASVNSSVELRCFVRGLDRDVYLRWTRTDGGKIPAKSRLQDGVLYIPNVQPEDAGEYSCSGIGEADIVLFISRRRLAVVETIPISEGAEVTPTPQTIPEETVKENTTSDFNPTPTNFSHNHGTEPATISPPSETTSTIPITELTILTTTSENPKINTETTSEIPPTVLIESPDFSTPAISKRCGDYDLNCIEFSCSSSYGRHVHPNTRRLYIVCINWRPMVMACGIGQVLSVKLMKCVLNTAWCASWGC